MIEHSESIEIREHSKNIGCFIKTAVAYLAWRHSANQVQTKDVANSHCTIRMYYFSVRPAGFEIRPANLRSYVILLFFVIFYD